MKPDTGFNLPADVRVAQVAVFKVTRPQKMSGGIWVALHLGGGGGVGGDSVRARVDDPIQLMCVVRPVLQFWGERS